MKEYISKEYINNLLEYHLDHWCGPEYYTCSVIQDEINDVPDSEIIRVGTAHWIPIQVPTGNETFDFKEMMIELFRCSACDGIIDVSEGNYKFCPYCGKIMTKENSNGNV